jgi:hypothetical protein
MFKKTAMQPNALDAEINLLHLDMYTEDKTSEKYAVLLDRLIKLYALKETPKSGISADVKATIAANIAGILIIVGHERAHVVTSKALGFIQKLR